MTDPVAVVSLHDVTPAHEARLQRIVALLARQGVTRTSILAIPRYHGGWELSSSSHFCAWLRDLETAGHEVVLHGYEHKDPTPWGGGLHQKIVRHVVTQEGEFYTLSYAESRERIRRGVGILRTAGFAPRGFVPPGWLYNEAVLQAARDEGLCYLTSRRAFFDLRAHRTTAATALCFSSRSRLRADVTTAYAALRARWLQDAPVVRVAVHPGDIERPRLVTCLVRILRSLRASRRFVAYGDLLSPSA